MDYKSHQYVFLSESCFSETLMDEFVKPVFLYFANIFDRMTAIDVMSSYKSCLVLFVVDKLYSHGRKSSVMEYVLHSHFAGVVREQHHAHIGTLVCGGIAQRGRFVCNVESVLKPFYAAPCCSPCRRLRQCIDADVPFLSVDYTEIAGYGFQ